MGENPIKETIKLKKRDSSSRFLELKKDGTACAIYVDDDGTSNTEETEISKYKYSYDSEKKSISMILEKSILDMDFEGNQDQLMTYGEIRSKVNEELTVEKMRQGDKEYYEGRKDDKWFKEDYPNCDTYEKYEAAFLKKYGYNSYDDYVKDCKQEYESYYKAAFSAKITYVYKLDGDNKMTLTEKFTGVKNLVNSECRFSDGSNRAFIDCSYASIEYYNDGSYSYYYGNTIDTDDKTISFESRYEDEDGNVNIEKVNATYTEDIDAGTVTINFKDKEYVCEFEGAKYTQI